MATRDDVARHANVSPATVSFVLNNTKKISLEVRKRVLEASRILQYTPNNIARSLATKRSRHIGIIFNEILSASIGEIVTAFEAEARENGYITSLILSDSTSNGHFADILSRRLDGLFLSLSDCGLSDYEIESLKNQNVAIVTGDRIVEGLSSVRCEYYEGMRKLLTHLSKLGHSKVGFLSGLPLEDASNLRCRHFSELAPQFGIIVKDEYIVEDDYNVSVEGGETGAKRLLERTDVTAIITTNDSMATGALKYLRDNNIRVPAEISVCACDGNSLSHYINPALTYISSDKKLVGKTMFLKLKEAMSGASATISVIPMSLHIGETTGINLLSKRHDEKRDESQ